MNRTGININPYLADDSDDDQIIEPVGYDFGYSRRAFISTLGAGLLLSIALPVSAQNRETTGGERPGTPARNSGGGRRGPQPVPLNARLHLGEDGTITVLSGKVEGGQGARAELTQAAAQELGVSTDIVRLVLADTALVPDDGITAGSRTTPSTIPAIREACATARQLLLDTAGRAWNVDPASIAMKDGAAVEKNGSRQLTYADLARSNTAKDSMTKVVGEQQVELSRIDAGEPMGTPLARPNAHDIVSGAHQFPSDVVRPGMLYGKVLRAPSFGATIATIDLDAAKSEGVTVTRAENFVGVAALSTFAAKQALEALQANVTWTEQDDHPTSENVYDYLRKNAESPVPAPTSDEALAKFGKPMRARYDVAFIQHCPLEARVAVAEWENEKLTVWTATQNPFGVRRELAQAFHIPEAGIRVIVPDFGGGFGGKHTGECAVEAAKIAQAAKKPVCLKWTRSEEFTWAAFRPAATIDIEAAIDDAGELKHWRFININSGRSGIENPYRVSGEDQAQYITSKSPLRHASYRALASTANHFARESFIDELAASLNVDPLKFRLDRLKDDRQRAVLEAAAEKFGWARRRQSARSKSQGIGLSCGTDKGGFVAACVLVEVTAEMKTRVLEVVQAFDCGLIVNPANLKAQNEGAVMMALGPALREATTFAKGRITNATFWRYDVPRMKDLPTIEVHLINRPDIPSAGAGETPLIALAPAIANAVFAATGQRLRTMPMKLA